MVKSPQKKDRISLGCAGLNEGISFSERLGIDAGFPQTTDEGRAEKGADGRAVVAFHADRVQVGFRMRELAAVRAHRPAAVLVWVNQRPRGGAFLKPGASFARSSLVNERSGRWPVAQTISSMPSRCAASRLPA